jgi:hypothetical protein
MHRARPDRGWTIRPRSLLEPERGAQENRRLRKPRQSEMTSPHRPSTMRLPSPATEADRAREESRRDALARRGSAHLRRAGGTPGHRARGGPAAGEAAALGGAAGRRRYRPRRGSGRGAACGSRRPPTLAFPPPVLRVAIRLPRPFKSRCASLLPRHLLEHTGMLLRTSVGLSSSVTASMTPSEPASQDRKA